MDTSHKDVWREWGALLMITENHPPEVVIFSHSPCRFSAIVSGRSMIRQAQGILKT
jgi:hypothetical protein